MTAEDYLKQHTLDPEFVKKLGWQWDEEKIIIPYYDSKGNLLHCRYRHLNGEPKFDADPGSKMSLYAAHKIQQEQMVVLCEGEPDCARLWQEGIPAVTAGGVSSFSAKIADILKDKDVIVLMDNDTAGQRVVDKCCGALITVGALPRVATLPEGIKDICEYFAQGATKATFQEIINQSLSFEEWQEASEPEEFNIISATDILKKELPEQEWLLDRMIPAEGFTFIIGSEGTGKSFDALTMANAIATGEAWLKTFEVKKKTKVLFIDKESVIRRIQARMKGLQITGEGIYYLEYPQYFAWQDSNEENGFSPFAQKLQRYVVKNEIGLIFIDSFADVMLGNENSVGDTQIFFDGFRQLFPNTSIVVLHHPGKPSAGVTRTLSQRSRGSTNIMAQVYSAFYTEAIPRYDHQFSFEHIKAGDTQKIKKFKIEMEVHEDFYDKSKTSVTGLRYAGIIEDEEDKLAKAIEVILETLNSKPEILLKELSDVCVIQEIAQTTFRRGCKQLEEEKVIEKIDDPLNKSRKMIRLI